MHRQVSRNPSNLSIQKYMLARDALWHNLHAVHPHPISKHIQRQIAKRPDLPIFAIIVVSSISLFFLFIAIYSRVGVVIMLTLPLWLMLLSTTYMLPWLYRIATIIQTQHSNAIWNVMGVIPRGTAFVTISVCHAVMNTGDQIGWIRYLRLTITLFVVVAIGFGVIIAAMNIPYITVSDTVKIVLDLSIVALLLYSEHQQSILIGCYLSVLLDHEDANLQNLVASIALYYLLIQSISWMIPLLLLIILNDPNILVLNLLFITLREAVLFLMWHRTYGIQ